MWLRDWFFAFPFEERCALVGIAAALLIFSVLGGLLKNTGVYLSGGAFGFGALALAPVLWSRRLIGTACLAFGTGFAILFFVLTVKEGRRKRKERKAEALRRMQYALPERDNSYIRARLNTALKEETEDAETERRETGVKTEYARRLVAGLKNAPVSAVERLETEELSAMLELYFQKESWTKRDLSAINELFARLLKLSAKYGISV